jgi:hypothetical protein
LSFYDADHPYLAASAFQFDVVQVTGSVATSRIHSQDPVVVVSACFHPESPIQVREIPGDAECQRELPAPATG